LIYPNGYLVWEGPSPIDGAPIASVVTGLRYPSENPKTGPMAQQLVLRTDVPPDQAVKTGLDKSVCGDCELRQFSVKSLALEKGLKEGEKPPMCYVTTHRSVLQVFLGIKRGIYPQLSPKNFADVLGGKRLRLGSYGNVSVIPRQITEVLIRAVDAHTLYEHDWGKPAHQWLKQWAMASVSSPSRRDYAKDLGWRTFRVKKPEEPVLRGELVCPASEEAGHKTDCYHCGLCAGLSVRGRDIVINDHGPTSAQHTRKVSEARARAKTLQSLGLLRRGDGGASGQKCGA
jgi:hypothetical protein